MKVTVELPDWVAAAILQAKIPLKRCGPTLEERVAHCAKGMAMAVIHNLSQEMDRIADASRYHGLRYTDEQDDDIPF